MKLLIAEDEEIERKALRDILSQEPGVELVLVPDGQEALDLLCDGLRPQLCLIDIRMPRLDGLQLLQRIRRDSLLRDLQVVVTSANRDRNVILAFAQLGISGYLLKPYDPEKVRALFHKICGTVVATTANPTLAARNLLAKTLLIVDDDKDIRTTLRVAARAQPGWETVEAQNGEEALLLLKQGLRPALCFCDITMPKLDGYGFVRRVREDPALSSLPIVIISAENNATTVRQLAEQHISGYLMKPFDLAKIRALLQFGLEASPEATSPAAMDFTISEKKTPATPVTPPASASATPPADSPAPAPGEGATPPPAEQQVSPASEAAPAEGDQGSAPPPA
jgi:CheY-like chemotaxis protein